MSFLMNAWYVAAFSGELSMDKPLARTIVGLPLVFYRDDHRKASALADRCAHRFAPLSRGRVVAGAIECPYHGLRFDGHGACVLNPHGDGRVPDRAAVRSFPTLERYGAIWVWPGEPSRAAVTPLPDFEFLDPRHNFTSTGYLLSCAHYQLSVDNILDLSHVQFLHPETLGSDAVAAGAVESFAQGDAVWVRRSVTGERLPPLIARAFQVPEGALADRRFEVCWVPPGLLILIVRVRPSGMAPEFEQVSTSAHWLTPQTESSTHYFFAFGVPHSMGFEGVAVLHAAVEALAGPFRDEDLPMLEAQQQVMGDREFWSMQPVLLPMDAGALRARRIMERLIAHEAQRGDAAEQFPRPIVMVVEPNAPTDGGSAGGSGCGGLSSGLADIGSASGSSPAAR